METYIRKYDNLLSPELCDKLIDRFENNPDQYEKQKQGEMSFTQIHLSKHKEWTGDSNLISSTLGKHVSKYREDCNIIGNMWPDRFALEPLRMKRYLPDGTDQFGDHVDVNSHESARRFLVFFLYLDDNEKGNTTFPQHDISSGCKKGSCLIFPPMWPWLHAGEKPIDKPKYIVGSYLLYV
jgi:prolyl 4-hydroxylase